MDYGEVGNGERYQVIFFAGTNYSSIDIPITDDILLEQNEEFTIRIIEKLLPFGIKLTTADVDNDSELLLICTA